MPRSVHPGLRTLTGRSREVARTLHLTGATPVPGLILLWPGKAAVPRTSEAAA